MAHVKLAASRVFWLVAYAAQSHEMPLDAHTRAFAAFVRNRAAGWKKGVVEKNSAGSHAIPER